MKSHSESLLEILGEIFRLYGGLESLLKEEKHALVKNSLGEIVECGRKKESVSKELSQLEERRSRLISTMAIESKMSDSQIDLSFLSKHPDPVMGASFSKMKTVLTPLLKRVGQLNRENKFFVEESMSGIASTFSFFNRITADQKTYRGSGEYASHTNGATGKVLHQQI